MKQNVRFFLLALALTTLFTVGALGAEADCKGTTVTASGFNTSSALGDQDRSTYTKAPSEATATVSRGGDPIYGLYVVFDRVPGEWSLTDTASGQSVKCGENGYLHEYVDLTACLGGPSAGLTLHFPAGAVIADIYAFSSGELPDWVQVWTPPCDEADLMLLSTHSDDEQLFFAGVLPDYAGERQLKVQVVYLIQHFERGLQDDRRRPHELLDGLWTVGVRNYPVISEFPDLYAQSKDRAQALAQITAQFANAGYSYDDFVAYITENIRRFKPLVIVSHDLDGEYGHAAHVLCAAALGDALTAAADGTRYPGSAGTYGTWEVPKTYLHLYPENPIVMDWDVPLERFGGKTAFQVTQDGFRNHTSQHWTWFYKWIYGTADSPITRATQIATYSPCRYGLFDTKVGPDTVGGDFLENIETYEAKAAREAEEARLKAEAEEKARQEAEAKAKAEAEEQARREAELRAQAEAEAQAAADEARQRTRRTLLTVAGIIAAAAVISVLFLRRPTRRRGKRER